MKKEWYLNGESETIDLGKKIGAVLQAKDVVLLIGDLGCGKTTLTKGIGQALGVKQIINSPTFTIVKKYVGKEILYHLDLYRLDGLRQDFDLEEYFESDGITVVEWPFQVSEILPDDYLKVTLERSKNDTRKITVEGIGKRYRELVEKIA